ncbi:MliC family protein [Cohaesibacter gelatinilyticus]|uniref:Membrane-bound lysozyme-inhibitor of c-type lysozyme n=1 Tax=Cohaesibacter gelatinilyticus TaxID=372072 RepID=A0A285PC77_9HYPH|nr:MliC family protein [Cohaesibacter gelatinilyticus]SNZ19332.1 Membrane-bound lysozyme-inhibitor of c-type lysozyme [Cohaesibacter gelatinilyticus]
MRLLFSSLLAGLLALATPAFASPDIDFPQSGYSYGGKVRSGPGMGFRQVGSLREGDPIVILNGTGSMMNGYEWFEIRYRNGRRGFQWGGIMCSSKPHQTIFRTCDGPRLKVKQSSVRSRVNGFNVAKVRHSGGSFTHVGNGQWQEADARGRVNFHFREIRRGKRVVRLHDASRNVFLSLDLKAGQIFYAEGSGPARVLYRITGASARAGAIRKTGNKVRANRNRTVRYSCAEGIPLVVTYVNKGNGHAIFSIDGSPKKRLEEVVSGSGSQYTNGRFTLFSKGRSATLEHPAGVDNCFE